MHKLFTDVGYIELMNKLGDYLKAKYNLDVSQVQELKHKIHLMLEEMIKG